MDEQRLFIACAGAAMLWYCSRRAWLLMWASDEEIAARLDRDLEFGRRVWRAIVVP